MQIETERLTLRPLALDDLDDLARFVSDPETMRYIGGGGTRTPGQARDTLGRMIESFQARGYGQLGLVRKKDGAFLGREHWGNGYATEAALAVRDWALAELGLERLIALIYPDNVRSIRVAEKLGMEPEDEIEIFGHRVTRYSLGKRPAL